VQGVRDVAYRSRPLQAAPARAH